jgi:hypothetical protein
MVPVGFGLDLSCCLILTGQRNIKKRKKTFLSSPNTVSIFPKKKNRSVLFSLAVLNKACQISSLYFDGNHNVIG